MTAQIFLHTQLLKKIIIKGLCHKAWAYVGGLKPHSVRDDTALTESMLVEILRKFVSLGCPYT